MLGMKHKQDLYLGSLQSMLVQYADVQKTYTRKSTLRGTPRMRAESSSSPMIFACTAKKLVSTL